MQLFTFSPEDYREDYEKQGYVHIKGGVDPEFLASILSSAEGLIAAQKELEEWAIKRKKQQYLYDFPPDPGFRDLLYRPISQLTGLDFDGLTLCERHIKAYEVTADPGPPPHKDRFASEVAVGIPLRVGEGTYVALYPRDHTEINPFNSSAHWRDSLDDDQLPEVVLRDIEPVKIYDEPGDILAFRGSTIYHERMKAAGTMLLYFKFNEQRLDPIGEDPSTPVRRDESLRLLQSVSDDELVSCSVHVSPQLDRIIRNYTRNSWKEVIQANVWDKKAFTLSEDELKIIFATDRDVRIAKLFEKLGIRKSQYPAYIRMLRRLVKQQALDLAHP